MSETATISTGPDYEAVQRVKAYAHRIRRNILLMGRGKGDGYVGQGLGAADIFASIYFHLMRLDAERLDWPDRDRFVLSTGHYSIALFATLVELGILAPEELESYGADESRLEMSSCSTTPGVEITGGSLGHGLSRAVGMALGSRLSSREFRVFNLLSDGELQEGATWEAAMAASHYRLDGLVALVDMNEMQADGKVSSVMKVEPVADKWRAFGWHAQVVNGNSVEELLSGLQHANRITGQPKVIVCYTSMGKGVTMIEQRTKAHFVRVEPEEWDLALRQLDEGGL
jgi:transketolase